MEEWESKSNQIVPHELSEKIIDEADDLLTLIGSLIKEWGNFRSEMNFLYDKIRMLQ